MKLLTAALAALLLAGCGTATPATTSTEDLTDFASVSTPTNAEDEYLYDLHNVGNYRIESQTDEWLIDAGYTVCDTLDAGYTVIDIAQMMVGSDLDDTGTQGVAAIVAAAVLNFCPQYSYQIESLG